MADPLTDASEFTVLAAAWTLDRQKDQIRRRAFAESITAWKASEKQIPLHWDHSGDPADIVGTVDSQSLAETDQGRFVSGRLHLEESARAREIWGSVKSGAISLSFGYLIKRSRKRNDGTRESLSLDLFEVSLTPSPANGDTRILSTKVRRANSARQLRGRVMEVLIGRHGLGAGRSGVFLVSRIASGSFRTAQLPEKRGAVREGPGRREERALNTPTGARCKPVLPCTNV